MRNLITNILLTILFGINVFQPFNIFVATSLNLLFLLFVTASLGGKLSKFTHLQKYSIIFSILILFLSLFVSLVNLNFEIYVIGRFLRLLVNTILLCSIINNLKFKKNNFLNSILFVLYFNTLLVILQYYFPQIKLYFVSMSGFNRSLDMLRSFGMFSSYDATGLLTCIFMLFSWYLYCNSKKKIYLFLFLTSFFSSIFISRYTMIVSALIFLYCILHYLKRNNLISFKIIFLLSFLVYIGNYVLGEIYFIISKSIIGDSEVNKSYASSSGNILLDEMIYFPDTLPELFLGTGATTVNSDIGYVKIIFMIGIIGLFLITYFYYKTYKKLIKTIKSKFNFNYLEYRNLKFFLVGFIIINFIFNSKLLLVYSKGFYELYLLLILGFEKIYSKQLENQSI